MEKAQHGLTRKRTNHGHLYLCFFYLGWICAAVFVSCIFCYQYNTAIRGFLQEAIMKKVPELPGYTTDSPPHWNVTKNGTPRIPALDAVWQPVGASHKFYVYSAYHDKRQNVSLIRVIGTTKTRGSDLVLCKLWYRSTNETLTSDGRIRILREHGTLQFSACFISCILPEGEVPQSVSITTARQPIPQNNLVVIDSQTHDRTNKSKAIGACVKPLHLSYNKSTQLVEFMELNRVLGIEHVTFYNSSISPNTDCILRDYMSEGRAAVLPWETHFQSRKEIRTENLIAALNDCLYRNRHNFADLAFMDVDEFIVPKWNCTLQQLIKTLDASASLHSESRPPIGSYTFQNGFFYLLWVDDPITRKSQNIYEKRLTVLLKTRRKQKLHKHRDRSKYIAKPTKVTAVGNHLVTDFVPGYNNLNVGPERGIVHHYRLCEYGGEDCIFTESVLDRSVFWHKDRLVTAVKNRWQKLQRTCGMGDI